MKLEKTFRQIFFHFSTSRCTVEVERVKLDQIFRHFKTIILIFLHKKRPNKLLLVDENFETNRCFDKFRQKLVDENLFL